MSRLVTSRAIPVTTHGRYLVREPDQPSSPLAAVIVGFHGYAETAETQMARLASLPGAERYALVAVQGLHRFYLGRSERIAASWMTSQDRDLAITDNTAYVQSVVAEVLTDGLVGGPLFFCGFSQGVAMAFRAACRSAVRVSGIVALGGDVPPELDRDALASVPDVLLGRGERDEWYSATKREADLTRLNEARVTVDAPVLDAAHEWTDEFDRLAGAFLESTRR